jgi:hypothetical protein
MADDLPTLHSRRSGEDDRRLLACCRSEGIPGARAHPTRQTSPTTTAAIHDVRLCPPPTSPRPTAPPSLPRLRPSPAGWQRAGSGVQGSPIGGNDTIGVRTPRIKFCTLTRSRGKLVRQILVGDDLLQRTREAGDVSRVDD